MANAKADLPQLDIASLPGPETIKRHRLVNGIVVLVRPNFASPSVVFSGYHPAGGLLAGAEKAGLAGMTASALMRGTETRDFQEIYQSVESIGASLRLAAGTHFASFRGKCLAEDLETLLDLLSNVLRQPTFPEAQVEQLRGEWLTSLTLRDQDTRAVASMVFDEIAYPGHPYSLPADGYRETVAAILREDLRQFHGQNYGPTGTVIAIVGAVEPKSAIELVEAALGGWSGPRSSANPNVPDVAAPLQLVRKDTALPGKTQSDIVLGAPGPRRSHPQYLAAALGNNILGRFGLMGRLGDSVREKAGLAYYASSAVTGGVGPGPWKVYAGVNPTNIEQAIDLCRTELERMVDELVTDEELADVKANSIGSLPVRLESNEGVSAALINIERHDLGLDYYQRFPDLVDQVTPQEIREIAAEFLSRDRLAVSVAGPELENA